MKLFLLLAIIPIFLIPAYADSFYIITDKPEYIEGETIYLTGHVNEIVDDSLVSIQIINDGFTIYVTQLEIAQDNSFTDIVIAEGELWTEDGEYMLSAYYEHEIVTTEFNYTTVIVQPEFPLILQQTQINTFNQQIIKWNGVINSTSQDIEKYLVRYHDALEFGNVSQIAKYVTIIGDLLATEEVYQSLIDELENQIVLYS